MKNRINEQKANRARIPYKNVEEIDSKISRLDKEVETGTMKLVDEKKALAEISNLKKLRKSFAGFDDAEKGISDVKSQIAELKKAMDNPEAKAMSDRYNAVAKELDGIKAEQDEVFKSLNSLRDERTRLQEDQHTKFSNMKSIQNKYYEARNAYRAYENDMYKQRQERRKAENEAYAKEKRKKAAAARLEEASTPAFMDEIMTAEGLINYFDPSSISEAKTLRGPSGFAAEAQRTVDDSKMKGTALSKKEDRDDSYFIGTSGKKGKKGKKGSNPSAPATPTEGKFNLSIGVIEELAKVNVDPPIRQSDVPEVIEKLKAKVSKWRSESDAKTKDVRAPSPLAEEVSDILARTSLKHRPRLINLKPTQGLRVIKGHTTAQRSPLSPTQVSMERHPPALSLLKKKTLQRTLQRRWRRQRSRTHKNRKVLFCLGNLRPDLLKPAVGT